VCSTARTPVRAPRSSGSEATSSTVSAAHRKMGSGNDSRQTGPLTASPLPPWWRKRVRLLRRNATSTTQMTGDHGPPDIARDTGFIRVFWVFPGSWPGLAEGQPSSGLSPDCEPHSRHQPRDQPKGAVGESGLPTAPNLAVFLGPRDAAGVQCVFRRAGRRPGRGVQRSSGQSRFLRSCDASPKCDLCMAGAHERSGRRSSIGGRGIWRS
jgi:hypothetical protein